ncbi:MAG: AbiV family abortive infection protein [archaeon]|nr:MAG: AbiV family abortive infection protein [archaeon]
MTKDAETDYWEIAKEAYLNAAELRDEAWLLMKRGSPRAFTLAVASIEELMKAQLADMVSKGSAKPEELIAQVDGKKPWPIMTSHKSKQNLFALFLFLKAAQAEGGEAKALEVDKILRDTYNTDKVNLKGKGHIIDLITNMEVRRQDSVYVGTKGSKASLKKPKREISEPMKEELLMILEEFLLSVEKNLMVSKERYGTWARELDRERKRRAEEKRP